MKKPLFYCAFFLSCIFIGCQKRIIHPQQTSSFEDRVAGESDSEIIYFSSTGHEKSIVFPNFDLSRPIHSEGEDVTITTYLDANYVSGSNDYWTLHDFAFGAESLQLMYHFVSREAGVVISDVYDMNRTYQFTYIDNHGIVSIDYDNPQNPQQLPPGFYKCMKQYMNEFDIPTIIYGAPFYAYFSYKCYKKLAHVN